MIGCQEFLVEGDILLEGSMEIEYLPEQLFQIESVNNIGFKHILRS